MISMPKLFVICGHGAGDCGACGGGYNEAERVRALGKKIKEYGGDSVLLGDMNRNYYKDKGISNLTISKDYQILELHMDCSTSKTAKGAHVIIKSGFNPDKYDIALSNYLHDMFPGRANKIVSRSDLANANRAAAKGRPYRLAECGFISNASDLQTFNARLDEIAKGILECFGIGAASKPVASAPATATPKPQENNTITKVSDTEMPTIKKGSKGKAVMIWQIIIGEKVDGDFGPNTDAKTRTYQKNHGLSVDGIVGPKSWKSGLESV